MNGGCYIFKMKIVKSNGSNLLIGVRELITSKDKAAYGDASTYGLFSHGYMVKNGGGFHPEPRPKFG